MRVSAVMVSRFRPRLPPDVERPVGRKGRPLLSMVFLQCGGATRRQRVTQPIFDGSTRVRTHTRKNNAIGLHYLTHLPPLLRISRAWHAHLSRKTQSSCVISDIFGAGCTLPSTGARYPTYSPEFRADRRAPALGRRQTCAREHHTCPPAAALSPFNASGVSARRQQNQELGKRAPRAS
jgi:hypothetical protein